MVSVATLSGGTGGYNLLRALKGFPYEHIYAVVGMADSGGSSGVLRSEIGILPPGDIRSCIASLADDEKLISELFSYRFGRGTGLGGHSLGNLMITALAEITGSFERAIYEVGKLLSIAGRVLPVTLDDTDLCVRLKDGRIIKGEHLIDRGFDFPIVDAWLEPEAHIYHEAEDALKTSDLRIISPGSLWGSIAQVLLPIGVKEAVKNGILIYVVNLVTEAGNTGFFPSSDDFSAYDHVRIVQELAGRPLNYVLVNTTSHDEVDRLYLPEGKRPVPYSERGRRRMIDELGVGQIIENDYLSRDGIQLGIYRHDPEKLGKDIWSIVKQLNLSDH